MLRKLWGKSMLCLFLLLAPFLGSEVALSYEYPAKRVTP